MSSTQNDKQSFDNAQRSYTDEEMKQDFNDLFLRLSSCVEENNDDNVDDIFHLIIQKCFVVPITQNLDDLFFVIVKLKDLNIKLFKLIKGSIKSNFKIVHNKILICISIIKTVIAITQKLVKASHQYSYGNIHALLLNTAILLCSTLKHCKNSKQIYGVDLDNVFEVLSKVFSASQQLQNYLILLIKDHIQFDLNIKNNLDNFIKLFLVLSDCGKYLITLNVKSTAAQWKIISDLSQKYKNDFENYMNSKDKFIVNEPITFLSKQVEESLTDLCENTSQDSQEIIRNVKLNSFFLKILLKFCELYKDYIVDSIPDILQMLHTLHRMYGPILIYEKAINNETCTLIQNHIYVAVQVLVGSLVDNLYFIETVLQRKTVASNFSYLILCVNILKYLIGNSEDVRSQWMVSNECNIIKVIFDIIKTSHYELSVDIKYTGVALEGKAPTKCDLFELLLTYTGGFVLGANHDELKLIEHVILKNVITFRSNNIWSNIMGSDLICLIDRYGTADLCYDHLIFFSELLIDIPNLNLMCELQFTFIKQTVSRVFNLLPATYKNRFMKEYEIKTNINVYTAIGIKNLNIIDVSALAKECENLINQFIESGQDKIFLQMCNYICLLSTCVKFDVSTSKDFAHSIVKIWECYSPTDYLKARLKWENERKCEKKMLTKFIIVLISLTSKLFQLLNNSQMFIILVQLNEIFSVSNISIKLEMCSFLSSLCDKTVDNDADKDLCFQLISNLFCRLLTDTNAIIEQKALESMINFSKHTVHEDLISLIVKQEKNIEKKIRSFLSNKSSMSDACVNLDFYLKSQNKFDEDEEKIITSSQTDAFEVDTVDDMFQDDFEEYVPSKIRKIEDSDQVKNAVNEIMNQVHILQERNVIISKEVKEDLLKAIDRLQCIVEKS